MSKDANKRYYEKNKEKISIKARVRRQRFRQLFGVSYYSYRKTIKEMPENALIKCSLNILKQLRGERNEIVNRSR